MLRRFVPAGLVALSLLLAGACTRSPGPAGAVSARAETAARIKRPCNRKAVPGSALYAELNYVQNCGGTLTCGVGDRNFETKEIAGAASTFLWTGSSNATIGVALQDSLLADARARAQAAKPANKTLRTIAYFGGVVVGSQSSSVVGANATYAQCGSIESSK
jgi:hypothetical protein